MKRRKTTFNDADFLDSLSEAERAWYAQFIAEYYFGRQSKDRAAVLHTPEQMQENWRNQYRERVDMCSQCRGTEIHTATVALDGVEALEELIDQNKF